MPSTIFFGVSWDDHRTYYDGMTLGRATLILRNTGWACACIGPPMPSPKGTPCCCRLGYGQAEQLQRAAHIVIKLVDTARRLKP